MFLNLGGVRPSPGAAMPQWPNWREISRAAGSKSVAAAGDGRAPYFENTPQDQATAHQDRLQKTKNRCPGKPGQRFSI